MISILPSLRRLRPLRLLWALVAALGLTAAASALPSHILLSAPADAPGLAKLPSLLADWRKSGLISDAWLLTSQGKADFAQLAVLEFPDDTCLARWQAAGKPSVGAGVVATTVDQYARGETFPRDSTKAVFSVNEYSLMASPADYQAYADKYVTPEMEALRAKKVIISYFLFAAQDRASAPWHSVLIIEYRENIAFEHREEAMQAARKSLASVASWKTAGEGKDKIRKELGSVTALWTLLPAPALTDLPSYKPEYRVRGTIRVLGSYLKQTTDALEEAFLHYQPETQFANNFSTSSEGAIGALATGYSDLAPAGDDAKISDMLPFFNVNNYLPTEISVATGDYEKRGALWPAAIVVNKDNPITSISMDELDRVFGAERTGGWDIGNNEQHDMFYTSEFARGKETNIRTWDQLGGSDDFVGKEIQTYGYCAPGFKIYWERKLFHWSTKYNPNFKEYVEPKQTEPGPLGTPVTVDAMLEAISKDKYGIGWVAQFHAKYYPNLKALAVAPGKSKHGVPYTPENVSNHTYPLSRDAYFYVNKEPGRPLDPKVREFMRFVLSREGQEIIAHTGFFYPLSAAYAREQLKKLD